MRASLLNFCVVLVAGWLAAGCFGNTETPFPDGLEPLEPNTAPAPSGEELSIVVGEELDYHWGHARGYVYASAADTWAALQSPEVVVDRRNTDHQEVALDVEPEYEFSFLLRYRVDRFITVEWEELWRYGTVTPGDPLFAVVRFQKVYGSEFIGLLEGSIIVESIAPDITEIQFVHHLRATGAGTGQIRDTFNAQYANLLAAIRAQNERG